MRGSRCCIIPLGSSLKCTASLSHCHRNTATNCTQEMPIHLQSDIYILLLYSVISGSVVLIILIIKNVILLFFLMGQNTHKSFTKMPARYARHYVFLLCWVLCVFFSSQSLKKCFDRYNLFLHLDHKTKAWSEVETPVLPFTLETLF